MGEDHVGSKEAEEEVVNKEKQWLFSRLAAVLGAKEQEAPEGEPDWDLVLKMAKQHAVLSLLDPLLDEPEEARKMPENVKLCIREEAKRTVRQNYHLLYLERQLLCELQKEGIEMILLKGASTACFYPVPELRKSGDVDLFLVDADKRERAGECMKKQGLKENPAHSVNHHEVFVTKEPIEVEMHTLLAEPFDDKTANRKMQQIQKRLSGQVWTKTLMGVEFPFPVLPDGIHAYYLLLHMLQHFLRAGFGLKLLCDWVVFWRRDIDPAEVLQYRELVSQSGLTGFSDMVTAVCIRFLGLEEENGQSILWQEPAEKDRIEFMEEILRSLEFGTVEAEQMVTLRGNRWSDLLREFHHQMHLNFPDTGKNPLLWPVLWSRTAWRFARNNRTIRKTTMRRVIKNARKRGKIAKKLHLFQR